MSVTNTIFILSDQFSRNALGCYGNPVIETPYIDQIAESGTLFTNAVSNSPLCCPARASLATGRYVHKTGNWDNAFPYDGSTYSWMHALREHAVQIDAVGKLHFRSDADDNGFSQSYNTMNVVEGFGDVAGCLRDDVSIFDKRMGVIQAGAGNSSYIEYDHRNAEIAAQLITSKSQNSSPWVLFWGVALPHPPNKAPNQFFEKYINQIDSLPPLCEVDQWGSHPAAAYIRKFFNFDEQLDESTIRKFIAAYYGACSYVDQQIGIVLNALEAAGQLENTNIIFTADHGEAMGKRGIFGKFSLYEESIGIPLIMKGPTIPQGIQADTAVSLVDIFPTMTDIFQINAKKDDLSGNSLLQYIEQPDDQRAVLSEYHGPGSLHGMFSLRSKEYKFIYHVQDRPELFHLSEDPLETHNLAESSGHSQILQYFTEMINDIIDPKAIDKQAKADQHKKVMEAGGYEAVKNRGTFDNTPIPGENAEFFSRND